MPLLLLLLLLLSLLLLLLLFVTPDTQREKSWDHTDWRWPATQLPQQIVRMARPKMPEQQFMSR